MVTKHFRVRVTFSGQQRKNPFLFQYLPRKTMQTHELPVIKPICLSLGSLPWEFPSLRAVKAMKSESLFSPCSIPPNQWGIKQTLSAASDLFPSSPVAFTEERLLPISIEPQFAIIITAMVMEIGLWRSIGNEPFWVISWKKEPFPFFNSWPLNSFLFFYLGSVLRGCKSHWEAE